MGCVCGESFQASGRVARQAGAWLGLHSSCRPKDADNGTDPGDATVGLVVDGGEATGHDDLPGNARFGFW